MPKFNDGQEAELTKGRQHLAWLTALAGLTGSVAFDNLPPHASVRIDLFDQNDLDTARGVPSRLRDNDPSRTLGLTVLENNKLLVLADSTPDSRRRPLPYFSPHEAISLGILDDKSEGPLLPIIIEGAQLTYKKDGGSYGLIQVEEGWRHRSAPLYVGQVTVGNQALFQG